MGGTLEAIDVGYALGRKAEREAVLKLCQERVEANQAPSTDVSPKNIQALKCLSSRASEAAYIRDRIAERK